MRVSVARRVAQVVSRATGDAASSFVLALDHLSRRGLVEQSSSLEEEVFPRSGAAYVGFDPTADSLHTGNLLAITALLHCQRHGCQPIAVVGGATGEVGDPSGRVKERDVMVANILEKNKAGLHENLERIFSNALTLFPLPEHQPTSQIKILDNAHWWREVKALDFVASVARHFRLGNMLSRDSVKLRQESEEGMSCAEFLYPIFQAYDFLHLNRHHDCWLQIGGRDQWGNIYAGVDFVKRAAGVCVLGVTLPLLTNIKGEKLGKSAGNAIWLDADKTSPYQFYQHFVQSTDQEVEAKLLYFTFLQPEDVQLVMKKHQEAPHKFHAQKCLAENVTKLVHGEVGLEKALNATAALFGNKDKLTALPRSELDQLFLDAPCYYLSVDSCHNKTIVEVVSQAGIYPNIGDAEFMVRSGGLYLNFERVQSVEDVFIPDRHILPSGASVFRIGKKNFRLVKWEEL